MTLISRIKKNYIDLGFYRKVLILAIPMIIQQTVTNFVSLLDNIFVGQLGTESMSGVAISNQLAFIFWLSIFGITSAGGIFGSQFYGSGDRKGHMYSFRFRIYLCLICSVAAMAVVFFFMSPLISLFLTDTGNAAQIEKTLSEGMAYMTVIIFTFIPFSIASTYASAIREVGNSIVPMAATLLAVATNLALDYALIFGPGPFPALGVTGAAIATLIARIVEMSVNIIWTHSHRDICVFIRGAYSRIYIPKKLFIDMLKKGFPLVLNELLWSTAVSLKVQSYSVRGLVSVAAFNISSTLFNTLNTVNLQLGVCLSILVGQKLGAGKPAEAVETYKKTTFFSLCICSSIAFLYFALGPYFPLLYNTASESRELATRVIYVCGMLMPFYCLENCYYFTLRSGGKTMLTFSFDCMYTWLVILPITAFLARYTDLSILIVFTIAELALIPKLIIGHIVVKKGWWINKIV